MIENLRVEDLTPSELEVYKFIIENYMHIPKLSISDISKSVFCSNTSVLRLLKRLGYSTYSDFKYSVKKSIENDGYEKAFNANLAKDQIKEKLYTFDNEKIVEICNLIKTMQTTYIYGRNMSSVPAKYLHEVLMSLDYPSILLEWIDVLMPLSKKSSEGDLIILFTEHMHSAYFPIIKNFKKNNSKIIWISNTKINKTIKDNVYIFIHAKELDIFNKSNSSKLVSLLIAQLILDQM